MPTAERRAEVVWSGDLQKGSGTFDLASSGAWTGGAEVSFATRTENPNGNTSPEELIAASHASCYAMALSNVLGEQGNEPEELRVNATCVLDMGSHSRSSPRRSMLAGVKSLASTRKASGALPEEAGAEACPVSNALRNNVDIQLNVSLD